MIRDVGTTFYIMSTTSTSISLTCDGIIEPRSVELLSLLMAGRILVLILVLRLLVLGLLVLLVPHMRIVESIRFSEHHYLIITFILERLTKSMRLVAT